MNNGDEDIAVTMEGRADWINQNTAQPDWDQLGAILELATADGADRRALWERAQRFIPKGRDDLLDDYRVAILGE